MDKSAIRERLGLSDLPTVLIVGGGDGMEGIVSKAKAVGERLQMLASSSSSSLFPSSSSSSSSPSSYQMVVVYGNNKLAQASLPPPETQWGSDIDVRVQGFVNNIDEYMCASGDLHTRMNSTSYISLPGIRGLSCPHSLSHTHKIALSLFLCFNFPDILVTKAGPGTIAEASICSLPCILSSFLPGQEEGNVPYVVDNGFSCYRGSPEGIANTVEEWFASTRA